MVNTTAHEVFKGICQVSEWWAKNFEGKAEKLNDVFSVRFGETFVTFKITGVIAKKKIVWHVTDCYLHWLTNKTEWQDTHVVFEISSESNSTKVSFTHVGLIPQIECYKDCIKGWTQYVTESLPKLLTEGKGQPD